MLAVTVSYFVRTEIMLLSILIDLPVKYSEFDDVTVVPSIVMLKFWFASISAAFPRSI